MQFGGVIAVTIYKRRDITFYYYVCYMNAPLALTITYLTCINKKNNVPSLKNSTLTVIISTSDKQN